MSKLSVGIVGLPNVGKSTLFNALLKKQAAYAANFPFATIEPNIGIVPVPDERLDKLSETVKETNKMDSLPPKVPATVEFVDIAGLIAGAHKGEGLGNKFLSHIRQTDAICHVVRAFTDSNIIKEGSVDPKSDFEIIQTELMMSDLQTIEKSKEKNKRDKQMMEALEKLEEALGSGKLATSIDFSDKQQEMVDNLFLLSSKPILIALNVDEDELVHSNEVEEKYAKEFEVKSDQVIAISARTEEQLAGFSDEETKEYLADLGIEKTGLERLIKKAFATLGLMTFLTAGEKEVRAWTLPAGSTAVSASGVIHTDFMKHFIKADVVGFEDFVEFGGWKNCQEKGKVRQEGRDYIVKDGDVIEFKIGK